MRIISNYFLILLATTLTINQTCFSFCITPEYSIHIFNYLTNNMNLHCWSQDDDLGHHMLLPTGEYQFHICTSIFGTTRLWCDFNSNNNRLGGRFRVFWVEPDFLDMCSHNDCVWAARDDGIFLLDGSGEEYIKLYNWDG
ncbi:Plant self-incompatibility protein S1 family [Euphorbia peplus]|nr:Plant self-incompatibility protein S1 family [Euphorbia peplus]